MIGCFDILLKMNRKETDGKIAPESFIQRFTALQDLMRTYLGDSPMLSSEIAERIAEDTGNQYIGSGGECLVVGNRDNPFSVVALYFADISEEHARITYNVHRIANLLYPQHFPAFYRVVPGGRNSGSFAFSVREKIDLQFRCDQVHASQYDSYAFPAYRALAKTLHIPIQMDDDPRNFGISSGGSMYFLDSLWKKSNDRWEDDPQFRKECLFRRHYSAETIEAIEQSVQQVIRLSNQSNFV